MRRSRNGARRPSRRDAGSIRSPRPRSGQLDPAAIAAVREQAWPEAQTADELHDALMSLGLVTADEGARSGWTPLPRCAHRRASRHAAQCRRSRVLGRRRDAANAGCSLHASARLDPAIDAPPEHSARAWAREEAVVELVRLRLQGLGPMTVARAWLLRLASPDAEVEAALLRSRARASCCVGGSRPADGDRLRLPADPAAEWCERRLLARIHRYTIRTLRAEIEPVSSADFMRFLLDWQGVTSDPRPEGIESLAAVIAQLEGYEIPAAAWESDVLAARMHEYDPNWLDSLCLSGRALWARLTPAKRMTAAPVRIDADHPADAEELAPLALADRAAARRHAALAIRAQALVEHLAQSQGASFFDDIVGGNGPAARAGRGGARRAGRCRPRERRQLQRSAGAC